MITDLRFALRALLKTPGFTCVTVLILALCIGANTAMFSIVRAVLLRPLPFAHAERIFTVQETNLDKGIESSNVSTASSLSWREQAHSFAALSASDYSPFTISGAGRLAERIGGWRVTANLFEVYGVHAMRGRLFTREDEQPGKDNIVLIRESLWQRMFNRDPEIIGRSILVNSQPHTIIGVLPDSFDIPDPERFEMWKPLVLDAGATDAATDFHLIVRGLLAPNVSVEAASAEMSTIARRLASARPADERGWNVRLLALEEDIVGNYRVGLWTLFATLVAVLLIGCVNLANLILTRAVSHQREIAIRLALGASRFAIVRQLFAESALLAFTGALAGILVAAFAMPVLLSVIPRSLPRVSDAQLDVTALLFTMAMAVTAGIAVALLPAWFATHVDALTGLKQGSSRTQSGDRTTSRWRQWLLVSEVTLSFSLLVVAALLLHSFANLRNVDPGFRAANVLNNVVVLPTARYAENSSANRFARGVTASHPKAAQFFERAYQELRALPGVEAVGSITGLPLYANSQWSTYQRASKTAEAALPMVQDTIGGDYFPTVGIPLNRGRLFNQFDTATGQRVALINEALAARDFARANPIGESIFIEGSRTPYQIVGVVGNTRQFNLDRPASPEIFTSVTQTATTYAYVLVRVKQLDERTTQEIRKVFAKLDPDLPLPQRTLQSALDQALGTARFQANLLGAFAGVALLLALIGVYGLLSYAAAERRPEMAIRSALGASAGQILQLIFSSGMKLVALGVLLGAVLGGAISTLLRSQLFQIGPLDWPAYLIVAFGFFATAAIACLLPARRAAKVNPMAALRCD